MALGRKPIEIVNDGKHQLLVKAEHWERIYLKEVAKVQNGYAFSSDNFTKGEGMPLIRIRDIDSYDTVDKYNGKYNEDFIVNKGDILIGMDGDFNAARWKGEKALLNQRVCRLIPNSKQFEGKFLFLCLQPFLNAIHEETSAVTVKHISSKTIEEIPLPFPPLSEQQAIVSKIEELFSELDAGIQNLKTAQAQLKTYRQAVLKWAFEGKLTNSKIKDGELPKGWEVAELGNVCSLITDGKHGDCQNQENSGYYFLSAKDVKHSTLNYENARQITKEGFEETHRRTNLQPGDICMVNTGASIGRIALAPDNPKTYKSTFQKSVAVIKTIPNLLDNKYCSYVLISDLKQLMKISTGTAVPNLLLGTLKKHTINMPPTIKEQQQIVEEIESRLSVADKMEESINQSLQQAEALRQSILKKAFEGGLL